MPQTQRRDASRPTNPFSRPKAATGDGTFSFSLPDNLGQGRGRITKGKYIGRCTSIISDTSKAGNPMWTWEFVITKGPHAGRDFKLWTVLTDDAAWKIAETLNALGIKVKAGDKIKIRKQDVIGVGCTMHIKDDAGQDGDGEFSKLDKISAHPQGAGFRPGAGSLAGKGKQAVAAEDEDDDRGYPAGMDDDVDIRKASDTDDDDDPDDFQDDAEDDDDEDLEQDEVEDDEDTDEEDEPEPPQNRKTPARPAAKKTAAVARSGGRAQPSFGKKTTGKRR